ncbi:MAG: peptidyl-prolyl cis-trans isomerase [Acidobacteria bacterium]|nr:peptidyl-prolyl cis-trans isomerase [Acidobacteriota bacterium]
MREDARFKWQSEPAKPPAAWAGNVRPGFLVFLVFALSLSACGLEERFRRFLQGAPDNTRVLRVGEAAYSRAELDSFFDSRLNEFRDPANADSVMSGLLESFIEEKLLLSEAERRNVQPDRAALNAMMAEVSSSALEEQGADAKRAFQLERSIADSLKMQRYIQEYLLKGVEVTNEECEAYYNQHLSEFVRGDVVHVREILVDDLVLAQRILAMLKAGRNRNFAELARLHSKAATAAAGGDMGRFERGDLPEEFEKIIFGLTPGSVSKIVRTRYGYHTFLLEEKIRGHQEKFYEAKDRIREKLLLERQREVIAREVDSLMKRIPVEIYRENLGFNYVGTRFASPGEND